MSVLPWTGRIAAPHAVARLPSVSEYYGIGGTKADSLEDALTKVFVNMDPSRLTQVAQRVAKAEEERDAARAALTQCVELLREERTQHLELFNSIHLMQRTRHLRGEAFHTLSQVCKEYTSLNESLSGRYLSLNRTHHELREEYQNLLAEVRDLRIRTAQPNRTNSVRPRSCCSHVHVNYCAEQ